MPFLAAFFLLVSCASSITNREDQLHEEPRYVHTLTDKSFDDKLVKGGADKTWLVAFYEPRCYFCASLSKELHDAGVALRHRGADACAVNSIYSSPTVRLFDRGEIYNYDGPIDADAMVRFVERAVNGTATDADAPSRRRSKDALVSLSADNWRRLTRGKRAFIKFYAPWCGHCKKMAAAWRDMAADVAEAPATADVVVAQADCTVESTLCRRFKVVGFPTLVWLDDTTQQLTAYDYRGSRQASALSRFVDAAPGDAALRVLDDDFRTSAEELEQQQQQQQQQRTLSKKAEEAKQTTTQQQQQNSHVTELGGDAAERVLPPNTKQAWAVLFTMRRSCEACDEFEKTWREFSVRAHAQRVNAGLVDCDRRENRWLCMSFGVDAFPEILIFTPRADFYRFRAAERIKREQAVEVLVTFATRPHTSSFAVRATRWPGFTGDRAIDLALLDFIADCRSLWRYKKLALGIFGGAVVCVGFILGRLSVGKAKKRKIE